jgi:hypothetical protein
MIKIKSIGFKHVNVATYNICSCCPSSRRTILTWGAESEQREVSDTSSRNSRPEVSKTEGQNLEPREISIKKSASTWHLLFRKLCYVKCSKQKRNCSVPSELNDPKKGCILLLCAFQFVGISTHNSILNSGVALNLIYNIVCLYIYCHVYRVRVTKITGSISDDWIYYHFGYNFSQLKSIQRYRWFTHFSLHRCTRTRTLRLH